MPEPRGKPPKDACSLHPEGGNRAVIILAAGDLADFADRHRSLFDKEWFERVPPHISLLGPFTPTDPDEKLMHAIRRALEGAHSFDMSLGAPDAFIVPGLFLFLRVLDEEPLHALNGRMRAALPHYAPARPYHPHLTLGRFVSEDNLARALAKVKEDFLMTAAAGFTARVEEVHLFGEDPATGVYSSIGTIALTGDED